MHRKTANSQSLHILEAWKKTAIQTGFTFPESSVVLRKTSEIRNITEEPTSLKRSFQGPNLNVLRVPRTRVINSSLHIHATHTLSTHLHSSDWWQRGRVTR